MILRKTIQGMVAATTFLTLQIPTVFAFSDEFMAPNPPISAPGGNLAMPNSTKSSNSTAAARAMKASALASSRARNRDENSRDWQAFHILIYIWVALFSIFALSLVSLVVRRYLRTMACLNLSNQAYFTPVNRHWGWLKKNFIFAPLFHKRHHRAFMITRTIDNGCLPSRPQTFLLISYFGVMILLTFWKIDFSEKRHDWLVAITKRSGLITLTNLLPLFILSTRNNPLIVATGISFDSYNLYHRWLGRFVFAEILCHATTYFVRKIEREGWKGYRKQMKKSWFVRSGTIAALCVLIIMFQTPAPVRHKFYEIFLHVHQVLAAVVLWAVYTHMKGYHKQTIIIKFVIAIWASERLVRLIRIIYRNVGRPMTTAEIQVMSPIAMRVKIRPARPWTFTPGQHAYIYMPMIGLWTAHPFSVAWNDEDMVEKTASEKDSLPENVDNIMTRKKNIYFLIRKQKGFTAHLWEKANKNGGYYKTTALLEGPYNQQTLHSYGTVILVAAGVGITHSIPHVRDLVYGYSNGTVAARRVLLIWSVRDLSELELIGDWMTEILSIPGRRDVLRIKLYPFKYEEKDRPANLSSSVEITQGICQFGPIFDEEVKNAVGSIGVSVCGIGVVADEVRHASRKWMDKVNIEFFEESFSW